MEKNKYYHLVTYGCQMNEHDSEKIAYIMESLGYKPGKSCEDSDFIIYNTCLVREHAELKFYGQLGALKHLKKRNPNLIIAVCGCMMQTGDAPKVIARKYRHVDIIFGTKNISNLPNLIHRLRTTGSLVVDILEDDALDEDLAYKRSHSTNAYINIMTGCNNFCSYCIVPYARGREISREPSSIIQEINELAGQGYKEITLLGQNVNSYGKTLSPMVSFSELLYQIHEIGGIERIRFLTSHPKDLTNDLIIAMASLPKVCNNLHLPLQSGSDAILRKMNRKYTRQGYLDLVQRLKQANPELTLSTDIIVGFPGESEQDFQDTLDLIKEVQFEQAFTFLYSIRKGTTAAEMSDQIPKEIKQKRFQILLDTLYEIFYERNKAYLGKTLEVLVEGTSKNNANVLTGRSSTYKLVHFPGKIGLIGQVVKVKIVHHTSFTLEGVLEQELDHDKTDTYDAAIPGN